MEARNATVNKTKHLIKELGILFSISADDYNRVRLQRDKALRKNKELREKLTNLKEADGIESIALIAELREQLEEEKNLNFILQQRLAQDNVNNVV